MTGGGIRRTVIRSPAVTVSRHAQAHPMPLGPRSGLNHRRCCPPLPPARAEPRPPRLIPPSLDLRPPHPRQEFRKPPRRSHEGTITGGRQQAAGHPVRVVVIPAAQGRGGRGEGHRTQRPAMHGCILVIVIIVGGSVGGGCPLWRLTGTEAATKEAAAAVIMTCFVVVGLWGMLFFGLVVV
jgi:hypothetical protein